MRYRYIPVAELRVPLETLVEDEESPPFMVSAQTNHFKRFFVYLMCVLQWWVPVALDWTNRVQAAEMSNPVEHASEGQAMGVGIMQSAYSAAANATLVDGESTRATETQVLPNGGVQFNPKDFGMTTSLGEMQDQVQQYLNNPAGLKDDGIQVRRNLAESGCRETSFALAGEKPILTITPYLVYTDVASDGKRTKRYEVDTSYSGSETIKQPTIGYAKDWEKVLSPTDVGVVGRSLMYVATPFYVDNDGSNFTYNDKVVGSAGNPIVASYGSKADGWSAQTAVTFAGGPVQVTAQLYRVVQTFHRDTGSGCPLDPPSCIVSGVNFCGPPAIGVMDVFGGQQRSKTNAQSMAMQALTIPMDAGDPDIAPAMSYGGLAISGKSTEFGELFQGCRMIANSTDNTLTVHNPLYKTCNMIRVGLNQGCSGQRGTHFSFVEDATVLKIQAFQKQQVPILDPVTHQPVLDAQGHPITAEQNVPVKLSGPVDVNYPTFGGGSQWDTPTDANGYFLRYTATPYSVTVNDYFSYTRTFLSDGTVSATVQSYGSKDDGWKTQATVSVTNASELDVNAKLYTVINNSIPGCDDYLKLASDGFCTANMTCTDNRGPCTTLDGVDFCDGSGPAQGVAGILPPWGAADSAAFGGPLGNGHLTGTPKEFLPRMCWAGTGAPMDCSGAFSAQMPCYTDVNGTQHCDTGSTAGMTSNFGEPDFVDDCAQQGLLNNPECRFITNQTCIDGAAGLVSGICYARAAVYDCGPDTKVTLPGGVSYEQSCQSPIRCLGTECHNPKGEVNTDFGKAVGSASTVEMGNRDMICAETGLPPANTTDPCTPMLFTGKPYSCKIPIGSGIGLTPNCCKDGDEAAKEAPDAVLYLKLIYQTYMLTTNTAMLTAVGAIPGLGSAASMLSSVGTAMSGVVDATTSMFVSAPVAGAPLAGVDVAWTGATGVPAATGPSLSASIGQALMANCYQFLSNIGLQSVADALFVTTQAADGSTTYALSAAAQAVMFVFMIYAILQIIGHIIYKCEDAELKLGIEKKQKKCTYVGTYCAQSTFLLGCTEDKQVYCCYPSPIARIISEQIKGCPPTIPNGQCLYGGFGQPSNPNCSGLTPQQVASADWSKIDLSEWVSLMQDAGMIPDSSSNADAKWGLNSSHAAVLAGQPSPGERQPADVVRERLATFIPTIESNNQAAQGKYVCYTDPTLAPWYTDDDRIAAANSTCYLNNGTFKEPTP